MAVKEGNQETLEEGAPVSGHERLRRQLRIKVQGEVLGRWAVVTFDGGYLQRVQLRVKFGGTGSSLQYDDSFLANDSYSLNTTDRRYVQNPKLLSPMKSMLPLACSTGVCIGRER